MTFREATRDSWWLTALVLVCVAAAWLRLQQFAAQVLLDDEWHALHTLFRHDPLDIALSFGRFDHSIPLTLTYQAMTGTAGLDEMLMRLPSLVAGLATILVGVLWTWRRLGPPTAVVFGWLLAISPLLVVYSRAARSYAPVVLLLLIAFWAAHAWWDRRGSGYLWLYAICAALGTWLHPLFGPLFLTPLLFFALDGIRQAGRPRLPFPVLKRLLAGGLAVALLTAPLVLPPLIADPAAIFDKAGAGEFPAHTLPEVAHLMAGTSHAAILWLFVVLFVAGTALLLQRTPRHLAFGALVVLVLAATLAVSRPAWMSTGYVMARYMIVLLPGMLLAVALAITTIAARASASPPVRALLIGVFCVLLALGNPVREILQRPVSHSLHPYFIADARPEARRMNRFLEQMPQSRFWTDHGPLLDDARSALALAPWRFEAPLSPLPVLERRTGRRVIPAFINGYCAVVNFGEPPPDSGVRLRNAVHLARGEAGAGKAGYLVWVRRWHIDPEGEKTLAAMGLYTDPLFLHYPDCEPQFTSVFGKPVYSDPWLAVFRLPGTI